MKLILVRHGETKSNKDHIIQGHIDTDLNATGIAQAKEAASHLTLDDFDAVICSDLKRAQHTARIMLAELGSDEVAITTPKLREMNYGSLQGSNRDLFNLSEQNSIDPVGGGESILQVYERVQDFINNLLKKVPTDYRLIIVSHNGPIAALLNMTGEVNDIAHVADNARPIFQNIDKPIKIPKNLI